MPLVLHCTVSVKMRRRTSIVWTEEAAVFKHEPPQQGVCPYDVSESSGGQEIRLALT